jgi:hypothetical protein
VSGAEDGIEQDPHRKAFTKPDINSGRELDDA